jgi:hypothetical protein
MRTETEIIEEKPETSTDVEAVAEEISILKSSHYKGCLEIHFDGSGKLGSIRLAPASRSIDDLIQRRSLK